jgi:hypothetical protein
LEHYPDDLSAVNREILRAALIARVDLNDEHVLREVRQQDVAHGETPEQRARERLRGLLLRDKLETEELRDIAQGMRAPR